MKTKLLAVLLIGGSSLFAETHFSIRVGVGAPAATYGYYAPLPPPPISYEQPPCPGPGYQWVGGYWYPVGPRYQWHAGYWARPPYASTYWVAPRYYEHRYYPGYWDRRERFRDRDDDRWERHERRLDGEHDGHWHR